ncbi:MAG: hypothetical protein AAB481_01740 [Patescibacteria group bacterium]
METLNVADATKRLFQSEISLFTLKTLRDILSLRSQDTLYLYIRKLIHLDVLTKLERGVYALSGHPPNEFCIANTIHRPSYISFETALNVHGILSQFPYEITSATTSKPIGKTIQGKLYTYSRVQSAFFFGYEKTNGFLMATPEKALLDQAYFAARGLRQFPIDEYDLSRINKARLTTYLSSLPHTPGTKQMAKQLSLKIRI